MPSLRLFVFLFAFSFIGQLVHISLIETMLPPRFIFRGHQAVIALSITAFNWAASLTLPQQFKAILTLAVFLLHALLCYRGRLAVRLLAFALWMGLYACTESIVLVLAHMANWNVITPNDWELMCINLFCTMFSIVLCLMLRSVMRLIQDHLSRRLWILLALTAISCVVMSVFSTFNLYRPFAEPNSTGWILTYLPQLNMIGSVLPLILLIGIFSLVYHLNNSMRALEESHLAETHAREELYRSELRIQKDEQQRHLMHDMKNHFLTVDLLAQQGQYERMHEYLAGLSAAFEASAVHSYCGHPLIDSILDSKLARMQKAGITAHFAQQKLSDPTALRIRDLDLCAVVGNLLDNAIEACEQLPRDAERCVKVNISATGNALVVQTLNPCKDAKAEAQRALHGRSVRGRHRGTGLKSVRRIVDAYGGELLIQPTDDGAQLSVSAYLPNPCA